MRQYPGGVSIAKPKVAQRILGHPLARIITSRLAYFKRKEKSFVLARVIRDVMQDVEQIARFTAPRYLSCYMDLLGHHLAVIGRPDLVDQIPDVNLWLEFGASQATQLSMMGLGLSRTAAIALSEFIVDDSLSEEAAFLTIAALRIDSLGLPLAIIREVKALVRQRTSSVEPDNPT